MQIDTLGLPKYGTDDLMDPIYKGKLDMFLKCTQKITKTQNNSTQAVKDTGTGQALKTMKKWILVWKNLILLLQNEWFMPK